ITAAWPLAARAEASMRVVGIVASATEVSTAGLVPFFVAGLAERNFIEGRNVRFEYRFADGQYERIPALARALVQREAAAIFAIGDSAWGAQSVTKTIPIVFANGSDPVEAGLVTSLSKPGGNVTGTSWTSNPLAAKRMELMRDLVPSLSVIGIL